MANLSTVIKRDLSGMGKWLFVGALAIIIGAIINVSSSAARPDGSHRHLAIIVFSLFCCTTSSASSTAARPTTSPPRWACT
jgi:modulator of FtsH protease